MNLSSLRNSSLFSVKVRSRISESILRDIVSYAHVPGVRERSGSGRGRFGMGDVVADDDILRI